MVMFKVSVGIVSFFFSHLINDNVVKNESSDGLNQVRNAVMDERRGGGTDEASVRRVRGREESDGDEWGVLLIVSHISGEVPQTDLHTGPQEAVCPLRARGGLEDFPQIIPVSSFSSPSPVFL